jgi:hypothetical protein
MVKTLHCYHCNQQWTPYTQFVKRCSGKQYTGKVIPGHYTAATATPAAQSTSAAQVKTAARFITEILSHTFSILWQYDSDEQLIVM